MLAYRLRHRVTFERQVSRKNGQYLETVWETAALSSGMLLENVPAEVLTGPGREFVGSGAPQSSATARINLRWFPASPDEMVQWRVRWDGRVYGIRSVETDRTARREWWLRCQDDPGRGV